jgi:hypothetical protein
MVISVKEYLRLIHKYHAVPLPCFDHASLETTSQGHSMVCAK